MAKLKPVRAHEAKAVSCLSQLLLQATCALTSKKHQQRQTGKTDTNHGGCGEDWGSQSHCNTGHPPKISGKLFHPGKNYSIDGRNTGKIHSWKSVHWWKETRPDYFKYDTLTIESCS